MAILEAMNAKELEYLPDLPDHALAEKGLIRQGFRALCIGCEELVATIPSYEGDQVYSLSCLMCGEVVASDVDAGRLFVEEVSRFYEEAVWT